MKVLGLISAMLTLFAYVADASHLTVAGFASAAVIAFSLRSNNQ